MEKIKWFLRQLSCIPIYLYQILLRPIMRPSCRFYPSCSQYALEALQTVGLIKGIRLIFLRLLRCHPWTAGGYDPVLPNKEKH